MSEVTDTAEKTETEAVETAEVEEVEEVDGQLSLADAAEADSASGATDAEDGTDASAAEDVEDVEDTYEAGEAEADEAEVVAPPKAAEKKAKKAAKSAQKPARASSGPGVPLWVLAVLGVLVVALGASTAWLWTGSRSTLSEDQINKAVRTAAASAQHISSWDYRTIEQDIDQVLDETTGDFHKAYEASAAKLLQTAPTQEAVTVGMTSKAGVEAIKDDGSVTVLVFLNQQTTSKDAEAHIEQHRLRLTMVDKDGEWLVSKLEVLG
ncbi:Mce-associated membrane protein [Actinocorallia herbida]|uniref:Mce-associated membrane protein n=1 Tax=Actinocorallia herbida TaxID=58109 RepID=A0A3N1DCD3_9ACTN|nr:hypothetical protein [Actinocorallia herbida]ROO91194.1 Mce-associated membrane protein [Actinocorallia herbida]